MTIYRDKYLRFSIKLSLNQINTNRREFFLSDIENAYEKMYYMIQ